MGILSRIALKNIFRSGSKPTQKDFGDMVDSFRHRQEKIAISEVTSLEEKLADTMSRDDKAEILTALQTQEAAWDGLKEQVVMKYSDGNVAESVIQRVDNKTNIPINYAITYDFVDGSPMTDEKVDGVMFIKVGKLFYKRQITGSIDPAWFGEKTEKSINQAIAWAALMNLEIDIRDDYEIDCSSDVSGVQLKSNVNLNFKGGCFLAKPSASGNYRIINIYNVENVKIINPVIIGERTKHIGDTGEWGHGISITNSRNVLIENPNIKDCWGDGIYIGNQYWDAVSKISTTGVTINNPVIDNARRNGISVTSNKNVTIVNPRITRTNGAMPQAGIDIEPEGLDGMPIVLDNINIINPYTADNAGAGIMLFVTDYVLPKDNPKIDINITSHIDERSQMGFFAAKVRDGLTGCVNIINPSYVSSQQGAVLISNWGKEGTLRLNIENPRIKGWNTSKSTFYYYKNAINIIKEGADDYANVGIVIRNPAIDFNGADMTTSAFICSSAKSVIVDGVADVVAGPKYFSISKGVIIDDNKGILRGNVWETTSQINFVRPGSFLGVHTNLKAADDAQFHITANGWTNGQRQTFLNEKGGWMTILFDDASLYESEYKSDGRLSSSQKGSKVVIEFQDGKWFVVEKSGLWSTNDRIAQLLRVSVSEPANPYYPMIWFDLSSNRLKRRDENNTEWLLMQ